MFHGRVQKNISYDRIDIKFPLNKCIFFYLLLFSTSLRSFSVSRRINNGVCRSLFRNFTCECLGTSYSDRVCEKTATKIIVYSVVSKSFAYLAIIILVSFASFIIIMDILNYGFGIDPTKAELETIRR